jgi:hypothetical protein
LLCVVCHVLYCPVINFYESNKSYKHKQVTEIIEIWWENYWIFRSPIVSKNVPSWNCSCSSNMVRPKELNILPTFKRFNIDSYAFPLCLFFVGKIEWLNLVLLPQRVKNSISFSNQFLFWLILSNLLFWHKLASF